LIFGAITKGNYQLLVTENLPLIPTEKLNVLGFTAAENVE
jgi:hypothetical protein